MDVSGVIAGINRLGQATQGLADASAQPLLDPRMFAGLEKGNEALAGALVQGGEMLQKFAEKRQDAINDRNIGRANAAMQIEYAKHVSERDKAAPETWGDDLQKRFGALSKRFEEDKTLSPMARDAIMSRLTEFGGSRAASVLIESSNVIFKEVGDKMELDASEAEKAGDLPGVQRAYTAMAAKGYYNDAQATKRIIDSKQRIFSKARDNDVATQPDVVRRWISDPTAPDVPEHFKDMSPVEKARMDKEAQLGMLDRQKLFLQDVKIAIANSEVRNGIDLAAFSKRLPEAFREPWVWQTAMATLQGSQFDVGAFNKHLAAIKAFDPTMPDATLRQAELKAMNETFPKEYASALDAELDQVAQARNPGPSALVYGRTKLNKMHDDEQIVGDDGKPLAYKEEGFLMPALGDETKLKAFGLGPSDAAEMRRLDGPARISWFREKMARRKRDGLPLIADSDAYNRLTAFTKTLFDKAIKSGEFVDPSVRNRSALKAQSLIHELESWASGLGSPPTAEQVDQWINDNTSPDRRASNADAVAPMAEPRADEGRALSDYSTSTPTPILPALDPTEEALKILKRK